MRACRSHAMTQLGLCQAGGTNWACLDLARPAEQLLSRQQCVHRAGTEAFQIESHKLEAKRFKNSRELRRHRGIERLLQLLARDFNADDFSMVTHPALPETQPAQGV